jgi:hypothetical protein
VISKKAFLLTYIIRRGREFKVFELPPDGKLRLTMTYKELKIHLA